jgi:alpha-N-arabinofuranosidase
MRSQDRNFVHTRPPDLLDDHFYISIPTALRQAHLYDNYDRQATKIFVGEWATNNPGSGDTPMMAFALGDAAWLTGLERNADVVVMNCYAPLFVNVNPGARQWRTNLIGYDAMTSFGSPSYYVQKMFSTNRGDVVLPATFDTMPQLTRDQIPVAPPPPPRAGAPPAAPPPANPNRGPDPTFDAVYVSATRETSTGDVILKLVNVQATPQPLRVELKGLPSQGRDRTFGSENIRGEVLTGADTDVNTVAEPKKIAPMPARIAPPIFDAGPTFSHELPAKSVTVLRLKTR